MEESNVFTGVAKALWKRGDDGAEIARDLAETLAWIIKEGKGELNLIEILREIGLLLMEEA